jgi:hypothetical protein
MSRVRFATDHRRLVGCWHLKEWRSFPTAEKDGGTSCCCLLPVVVSHASAGPKEEGPAAYDKFFAAFTADNHD